MRRAIVVVVGLVVFPVVLYYAADWEISRELLARGYHRADPTFGAARGMSLSWLGAFALPGLLAYAAVVLGAWRRAPALSAGALALIQLVALALTLLALPVFRALDLMLGAPLAAFVAATVVRRGWWRVKAPAA